MNLYYHLGQMGCTSVFSLQKAGLNTRVIQPRMTKRVPILYSCPLYIVYIVYK